MIAIEEKADCSRVRASLRTLALLRAIAVVIQAVALYIAYAVFEIRIPLAPVVGAVVFLAFIAAATCLRLRQPWPVTKLELFAQLLLDVAVLTVLLYFTGGGINPFAACYLLFILYAAVALPPRLVWALASVCMLCYAGLHFAYVPLLLADWIAADRALNYFTHFLINLSLAALVAGFGVQFSEMRRLHMSRIRAEAEKDARERYLLGLATLSAGTAHEISTPLSTISIVVGELRGSARPPPDWKENIDMLWGQIQLCKRSLNAMAHAAHVERLGKVEGVSAREFIHAVAERFQALRPNVPLKVREVLIDDGLSLQSDHTLSQALLNFLNNAADASPRSVELRAGLTDDLRFAVQIVDRGPGIAPELRERIGKGFVTTKRPGSGNGAGVLIAHAVIERFGGSVHIWDRQYGGTCVQIELPLSRVSSGSDDARDRVLRTAAAAK